MAQKGQVKVTFERGLNEFTESSRLDIGFATILENWVPEPDGSLRARIGWRNIEHTGSPATKKGRGIGYNPKHQHMGMEMPALVVANAEVVGGNPGYTLYHTAFGDLDDAGHAWGTVESVGGVGWDNGKYMPMVMAGGRLLYCTDDFPYDNTGGTVAPAGGVRAWDGVAMSAAVIPNSRPGRTMCYFKNRVFTAGGKATTDPAGLAETTNAYSTQPWRLWFSGLVPSNIIGTNHWDTTSLTNPAGFIEVGKDDGQPIEFIVPFDQGILIGKSDSLYYLVGSSPATFQLIPLDAGECAPGRSIVVTPYGAVVLGRTEAFLFTGNIPEPIDTPVSDSYGMTGAYLTGAYVDGVVSVVDAGRDLVCAYDLENDTWRTETVGVAPGVNFSYQANLIQVPNNSAMAEMGWHKVVPDGERGKDEDLALTLHGRTPEMWLGGTASPVTVRHAYIRYRVRRAASGTTDTAAPLAVALYKDGVLLTTQNIAVEAAEGVYRRRLDLKGTMYSTMFDFLYEPIATDRQAVDIEEVELFIDQEPPR